MRVLTTGGLGFLGSHFIKTLLRDPDNFVVNIDRQDPCSTRTMCESTEKYIFVKGDINEPGLVSELIMKYNIGYVAHFSAQSHVDLSFSCSRSHVVDNILGTHTVLEAMRECHPKNGVKMCMVSSDEVYGENKGDEAKTETSLMAPSSPYSASKAGSELLCNAYVESFKIPIVIVRGNNAYSGSQFPEKCIPRFITLLLANKPITIQGSGKQKRCFIHSQDFVNAVLCVMEKGDYGGQVYNIGSDTEITILELASVLAKLMNRELVINYVEDRNFNDSRYLISAEKLKALNWVQKVPFIEGLRETIAWYESPEAKNYWMEEFKFPDVKLVEPPKNQEETSSKRQKVSA